MKKPSYVLTKINILFRVSGGRAKNKEYGLGHIYHAMNLASQLKDYNIFFLVEDFGTAIRLLRNHGYKNLFSLKKEIDVESDVSKTLEIIKEKEITILIVDKHDLKAKKYVKKMRNFIKTIVILDTKKTDYDADLIINGFIGFQNQKTTNRYGRKCLLGPLYQILNNKYEQKTNLTKKNYDILATFGGFDENNIVKILYDAIEPYLNKIRIKIIVGYASIKSKKLRLMEIKYRKNLKVISSTKNLKKEIQSAKFGICGGGITTYEFATLNIPFAIICQYKHQVQTAREWSKKGVAYNLGLPNKTTKRKLQRLFEDIVAGNVPKLKQKITVDGFGAKRVAKEIKKMIH